VPQIPEIPDREVKRKEFGLGLGLESNGTTTSKWQDSQQEFVVFDGEWGTEDEVEREWDDNLMRNVTVRKRHGRRLELSTDGVEVVENNFVSPTNATRVVRSLPLQERIARRRLERDAADRKSTEKFAEQISWPATVADPESPTIPDVRRFSAISGRSTNSAVVEAMVIDTPPLQRKTLRHTKKYSGLRNMSSDQSTSSAQTSIFSSDIQHLLLHKNSRIFDRQHRSLASNTTASRTSSSRSRHEVLRNGGIPVVVIPDRRSSTKSSLTPSLRSTSSRRTKRSMSVGSAPLSNSAKFNESGNTGHSSRKRAESESAGSGHSVRTIDFPPTIPVRRSSLSAPASRNTSRAGSLTAESLKAHNMVQEKNLVRPVVYNTREQNEEEAPSGHLSVDQNGDPLFGARPSTQVTPFSIASNETACTTAEVSEAMAVTLFTHQNKSVLIVQHEKAPEASPSIKPIDTSAPTMVVNGKATVPVTPPQPGHPMDEVDSPLQNPRAPPEPPAGPPAIKFIPPTPAALNSSQEEDRQLGFDERPATSERPKRTMSLMRRAFSNRRNSEPTFGGFLQRTLSLRDRRAGSNDESAQTSKGVNPALYPSVADQPSDGSRLHPFWRPTHFWDDLEDHDSDADDGLRYPPIDNRPGPPKRSLSGKLKRTFAILPIKDTDFDIHPADQRIIQRTDDGMRVVKQRSNSSLKRDDDRRRFGPRSDDLGHGINWKDGRRVHMIPGLGLSVEYIGWSEVKRRLSERRRAKRSEKLRASISGPRRVKSGVDDVLRSRNQV
jgi:hypothetical protein